MDILKWAIFQKYGKMWVPVTNLLGDRARLRTLQSLSTQNTLVGWATLKLRVGFPCGNGVRVAVSSQSAILTETPTCALYRLGRKIMFSTGNITKFVRWKLSLGRMRHFPLPVQGKEGPPTPGYANTSSWPSLKGRVIHPGHMLSQWKSTFSKSHPSAFSTALPFVLADAL